MAWVFKTLGYFSRKFIFVKIFLNKIMKNSAPILTKFAFAVVIAGSVIACKQSANDNKKSTAPAVAVDSKATIVYVNQDSLLSKYEYVKDMTKRLNAKGSAAQADRPTVTRPYGVKLPITRRQRLP